MGKGEIVLRCHCTALLMMLTLVTPAGTRRALAFDYTPPQDNDAVKTQLEALRSDLAQKHFSDAASRYDGLLQKHADDLVPLEGNNLASVQTILRNLDSDSRGGLVEAYSKAFEPAAHQELAALLATPGATAEAFYAMSRQYPLTPSGAVALAEAGDRAALMGDWPSAREYYRQAEIGGLVPTATQRRHIESLRLADALPTTAPSTHPVPGTLIGYSGPIVCDGAWYGNPTASIVRRLFPLQAGSTLLFVTPRRVLAFREGGALLWSYVFNDIKPDPKAKPPPPTIDPTKFRNKRLRITPPPPPLTWNSDPATALSPSVLSTEGAPQIIIVRGPQMDGSVGLIALRASDGQQLWASADQASLATLSFSPDPVIAGRYVYALALDVSGQQDSILLIAMDISSGRELWRTYLGSVTASSPLVRQGRRVVPIGIGGKSSFCEPAGMIVDGDQLVLSPNVGYAMAVGRFDGKPRWFSGYPLFNPHANPPVLAVRGPRYGNSPGVIDGVAIVAAQDGTSAIGFNSVTGAKLWNIPALDNDTLVGTAGGLAIFAGDHLAAIDPKTGQTRWTYQPVGTMISGPPVIVGSLLLAPTNTGIVTVSAESGTATPAKARAPYIRTLMGSEVFRAAMTSDGVAGTFALPSAARPR